MNPNIFIIYFQLLIYIYNFEISNTDDISSLNNITKNLVTTFINKYCINEAICTDITNSMEHINSIYKIITDSGKRYNDLGSISNCLSNATLDFNFSVLRIIKDKNTILNSLNPAIKFLNMSRFLYGLCLPNYWMNLKDSSGKEIIYEILNKTINESDKSKIASIELYTSVPISSNKDTSYYIFIFLIILLILFLLVKIISWFLIVFVFTNKDKYRVSKIYEEENEEDEEEDEKKQVEKIMKNNYELKLKQNVFTKTSYKNIPKNEDSNFNENSKIKKILKKLDISRSLKYLTSKKNKYYDATNLELFYFFRTIAIFFMVYAHNFYNMTKNPVPNIANEDFYKSTSMIVLKFSTFCTVLYIGLEGFEASFKLFSYIKKDILIHKSNYINIRIATILKFLLYMVPSIIVLIFCVFTMGIEVKNYMYVAEYLKITVNPILNYFADDVYKCKCIMPDFSSIIFQPFSLLYTEYSGTHVFGNNRGFLNCYKYVNIFYNIGICYILLLIFVYMSIRIKNKIFEIGFISVIILCGAASYILMRISFYPDYNDFKYFSFDFLLGENYSYKYTHLFLCYYFYGAIAGIIYFYYIDVLSRKPLSSFNEYLPFEICFNIVKFIDSLSFKYQLISSIISFAIITILSTWFWIKIKFFGSPLSFDITNEIYKYLDLYEKQIFLICALIIILILLFHTGSYKGFKTFYSNSAFVFIGRSSHFMLCTMDFIISMFYCLYNIVIYFDFMSTLIYTIGQFSLCMFINVIFNILVEQPVKIWIKNCIGNKDYDPESANDYKMEVYELK